MNEHLNELLRHHSFLTLTQRHPLPLASTETLHHQRLDLTLLDTGVLLIEPENPSDIDIIISSGIHGNETAPIEICDLLIKQILKGSLKVSNRLLFIIGNPLAMNSGDRFIEENLNRLFCNAHQKSQTDEAKRAEKLEQYVKQFYRSTEVERCHFDLHTAIRASRYPKFVIYPYQDGGEYNYGYFNFFKDSGVNTILLAHQGAPTFSYFTSSKLGANAFTVELGQVKPFGENEMTNFQAIIEQLTVLIENRYSFDLSVNNDEFNIFRVVDEVIRHSKDNFTLNIGADIANFSEFPLGFKLTTDDNSGYIFNSENQAIVFPNAKIPVGNRVALIVEKSTI